MPAVPRGSFANPFAHSSPCYDRFEGQKRTTSIPQRSLDLRTGWQPYRSTARPDDLDKLIPDFIPVLGYLDDVIIVPLGIIAVIKLIPPEIMAQHRAAAAAAAERPTSRAAAIVIILIWLASIALVAWFVYRHFVK